MAAHGGKKWNYSIACILDANVPKHTSYQHNMGFSEGQKKTQDPKRWLVEQKWQALIGVFPHCMTGIPKVTM